MSELGKGDEERGEELLPVTETDDAELLGQTQQSTDGVLPRHPSLPPRRKPSPFRVGLLIVVGVPLTLLEVLRDKDFDRLSAWVGVSIALIACNPVWNAFWDWYWEWDIREWFPSRGASQS